MRLSKRKKRTLLIGAILFVVAAALIIVNQKMNEAFYYPQSIDKDITPLKVSSCLLAPSIQYTHEHFSFHRPHVFGTSEVTFRMGKITSAFLSSNQRQLENQGKLVFSFGKAGADTEDAMGIGPLTVTQGYFMDPKNTPSWNEIKAEETYEVMIGFSSPLTLEEAVGTYPQLFFYPYDQHGQRMGGVSWIPIQTSDTAETVCIGTIGSYHPPMFGDLSAPSKFHSETGDAGEAAQWMLEHLLAGIEYGMENQQEMDIYLNSGLFPGAESLVFAERRAYLEENPIKCLGLVVQAQGDHLLELANDPTLILLRIQNQGDLITSVA